MAVLVDTNNRISFDGVLSFEFANFENFLSNDPVIIDALRDDCLRAFTSRRSDVNDDDTSSVNSNEYHNSGSTFFQRSDLKPRCRLEELAMSIFRFHTKNAKFDAALSGAEWWTQVVDSEDDIGFHWDRDYGYEGRTGKNLYPHLATVTYLTNRGGPTAILSKVGLRNSDDCHAGPATVVVLSEPVIGKHIKFDGRLLHAAPSNLIPREAHLEQRMDDMTAGNQEGLGKFKRVTFLVNIWLNHIPEQATSFPECSVKNFAPSDPGTVFISDGSNSTIEKNPPSKKRSHLVHIELPSVSIRSEIQEGVLDLHRWNFVNGGKKYRVCIPLPSSKRLLNLFDKHSAFRLTYAGSGVSSQVESLDDDNLHKADITERKKSKRYFWRPYHLKMLR